jgi:hypothetical protein
LSAGVDAAEERQMFADPGRAGRARRRRRARKMKHIAGTALRVAGCTVVAITGVALLAGKDDIRKFRRMRSM